MIVEDIAMKLSSLSKAAKQSEDGEAYTTLKTSTRYRLGVGVRIGSGGEELAFLELLLIPEEGAIDVGSMEKKVTIMKRLQALGYDISSEEDGSISCEIVVSEGDLERKYGQVSDALVKAGLNE